MKKLIFIDNDRLELAKDDSDDAKNALSFYGHLPDEYVDTMTIISDFRNLSKDEAHQLLFSKENCVCTYSMYTASHMQSLYQLNSFLIAAGRNRIKGILYVDTSGMIVETLNRELPKYTKGDDLFNALQAIETNSIITFVEEKCVRIRVSFGGRDEDILRTEEANLNNLIAD